MFDGGINTGPPEARAQSKMGDMGSQGVKGRKVRGDELEKYLVHAHDGGVTSCSAPLKALWPQRMWLEENGWPGRRLPTWRRCVNSFRNHGCGQELWSC